MTFAEFLIFLAACLPFALMALAGSGFDNDAGFVFVHP
jgi:hypothetical protein